MMVGIFLDSGSDHHKTFLTDSEGNFRLALYSDYKANRKSGPRWLEDIKEYLISEYGAIICVGEEADDALGIKQEYNEKGQCKTIIATIDKDLKQIPGYHFNFVTKKHSWVTKEEGLKHFYTQLLMGDSGDNITGIPFIGIKKATKIIGDTTTEKELFGKVHGAYTEYEGFDSEEEAEEMMLLWGKLLKIRTKEGEIWNFPSVYKKEKPSQAETH